MKSSVIVFPASNCDQDVAKALEQATGKAPNMVWHAESELPDSDLIVLPGGFSYGDYLRAGAMASRAPIMKAVIERANAGTPVLGICNGFQILCEAGLLPGALQRNQALNFVCTTTTLRVESTNTPFTRQYEAGQFIDVPVAHHDGNYTADDATLKSLEDNDQIIFRYVNNPNGSANNIAGITNTARNVVGLMPHPERVVNALQGGVDGLPMFSGLQAA